MSREQSQVYRLEYASEEIQTTRVVHGWLRSQISILTNKGILLGGEGETCEYALQTINETIGRAENTLTELLALAKIKQQQAEEDEAEWQAADDQIGGHSHGRN